MVLLGSLRYSLAVWLPADPNLGAPEQEVSQNGETMRWFPRIQSDIPRLLVSGWECQTRNEKLVPVPVREKSRTVPKETVSRNRGLGSAFFPDSEARALL